MRQEQVARSDIAERRADGRLHARTQQRPPRWRRPARTRVWRFWEASATCERSSRPDGTQTSRVLRIGGHSTTRDAPLLVLGLHTWSRDARGAWVELVRHPAGHRAWAPALTGRVKSHRGSVRPYASVRAVPGSTYELGAGSSGVVIGPIDFLWG